MNGARSQLVSQVDNGQAERLTRALLDILYAFPVETKAAHVAREVACYAIDWMRMEVDTESRSDPVRVASHLAYISEAMAT